MTLSIIGLYEKGHSKAEIAALCGCTWQNVARVVREARGPRLALPPLSQEYADWLVAEAAKSNVTPSLMARAMLTDAIEEEMSKCSKTL